MAKLNVKEAEAAGWSDFDIALGIVTGEIETETVDYVHPIHGELVSTRFDAYHDVYVYEDGHEEKRYIGD